MIPLSDSESPGVPLATGLLPPGQERWFTFDGRDDARVLRDLGFEVDAAPERKRPR